MILGTHKLIIGRLINNELLVVALKRLLFELSCCPQYFKQVWATPAHSNTQFFWRWRFYPVWVDPGKVERQVCNNMYATSCFLSRPVVHTWADRNLWVARSLRAWLAFMLESCRDLFLVEHKTLHLEGGWEGGEREKTEKNIICKKYYQAFV